MAMVYKFLRPIDRPMYTLNSPFLSNAAEWTGGIPQMAQYFLECIRLVQPVGPWAVGGWSSGGMVAYELACMLATGRTNERVATLVILDSPAPSIYPPMPLSLLDYISEQPEVKDIAPAAMSAKLVAHFKATVDSLARYTPPRFPASALPPRTCYLVADEAVPGRCHAIPHRNTTVDWLFRAARSASAADGWDQLLPASALTVVGIAANHFTIVREPAVAQVARVLQEACSAAAHT
jgi:thioesterase domain-containing protein